ncbi:MAG: hypothetical protein KatS3mg126_1308 [Lysobacteraceae bacterium]|nr:MAG: hypothetical protein KatS3mg126_1308 [Xanthomonadaceae bacterium]
MSYLVLARKWRPKRFSELVGQEHVVRALSHALDSGRVHHAFLFTGTRGVGKTTIARIFAKSLNCETGVGAEPCGACSVCEAVDAGRFVDLIEIDAASHTGVDDVRELIENAQYLPSRGRYKVYLVDEVHMLSRNAFNALLKTLEEPPEHVKFLLATTDPQKLPITVLSRCLQFNLKRLTEEQIAGQVQRILEAEGVEHDVRAVQLIARAADGSLRDGLSLLDQAIAHGSGRLRGDEVAAMLGSVEATELAPLIDALVAGDGAALHAAIEHLAGFVPDYAQVLGAMAEAMHRIQLRQLVPAAASPEDGPALVAAAGLAPEVIQLWYQMAVLGRREIELAPSPRLGFEMVLLRMLAFRDPGESDTGGAGGGEAAGGQPAPRGGREAAAAAVARLADPPPAPARQAAGPPPGARPEAQQEGEREPARVPETTPQRGEAAGGRRRIEDREDWIATARGLGLGGPPGQLAEHAQFLDDDGTTLRLALPESMEHLKMARLVDRLAEALAGALGSAPRIVFGAALADGETLAQRHALERDARQRQAEAEFAAHPEVRRLTAQGARIVPGSVRPPDL